MQTIPFELCEKIGFIRKTHGVNGEVVLEYNKIYEPSIDELDRFFIELEGLLVPFFVKDDEFRYKSNQSAIIWFDTVVDEKYAKRLTGKSVYILKTEIIMEENTFPKEHLEGYFLEDVNRNKIGQIKNVDDFSGNIVLTVDFNGNELLIPFHEDLVEQILPQQKFLIYRLPEGII